MNTNYIDSFTDEANETFDDLLKQLKVMVIENEDQNDIQSYYEFIIKQATKRLQKEEFGAIKILKDIYNLKQKNEKVGWIIQLFVCFNNRSYQDIANIVGCSRQYVFQTIESESKKFGWLKMLFELKGREDAKNRRGKGVAFRVKGTV